MMYQSLKKYFLMLSLGFTPLLTHAQFDSDNATSLVNSMARFINKTVIPLLVLLTLVYVIYGVFQYVKEDGGDTEREEKKKKIFWGIIGLFVILSTWALVFVIANSFGLETGGTLR